MSKMVMAKKPVVLFRVDDGDAIDFSAVSMPLPSLSEGRESDSGWDRDPDGLPPSGDVEFSNTPFGLQFAPSKPPAGIKPGDFLGQDDILKFGDMLVIHFSLDTAKRTYAVLGELLAKADDITKEFERRLKLTEEERLAEFTSIPPGERSRRG